MTSISGLSQAHQLQSPNGANRAAAAERKAAFEKTQETSEKASQEVVRAQVEAVAARQSVTAGTKPAPETGRGQKVDVLA